MNAQKHINFERIKNAIGYIQANVKTQPGLDEIAEHVHLSAYHFQKMFTEWAGVSPKKFLQYLSTQYAKKLLKENQATLFEASHQLGLSGTSRLHDLFISIEGMTPAEYKHGGRNLNINYSFADSPFGEVIVASTTIGICHLAFSENREASLQRLKAHFSNATFTHQVDKIQQNALLIFTHDWSKLNQIKLHLRGTEFQLKVWESLIHVPFGGLTTYGDISKQIEHPKASRAVGSAVGSNPVAYLIPCHRVIQSSGNIGEYHWGSDRKTAIIGWEASQAQ